jgi:putative ABC transport system ATP-binding protein
MTVHQVKAVTPVAAPDIVAMSGVRFAWPSRDSFRLAVDEFTLQKGERLLLVGPSGSGKSTFLSLLAGIVTPQAGSITILGTDIAKLRGAARDRFRAEHFGIIFQMFNLLPYGSVIDNVLLPLSFSAERRQRATARHSAEMEAASLLANLGIPPSIIKGRAPAATLSVGQQQRVAVARALIGAPQIIVADEPTSALDRARQLSFLDVLFSVVETAGATLVMVSHDESLVPRFSRMVPLDAIAQIDRGGEQP